MVYAFFLDVPTLYNSRLEYIYISKNVNKLFSTLNFITSKQIETMGNGKQIKNNGTG